MQAVPGTYLILAAAAVAEIAGCFAFWSRLRSGLAQVTVSRCTLRPASLPACRDGEFPL